MCVTACAPESELPNEVHSGTTIVPALKEPGVEPFDPLCTRFVQVGGFLP